MWQPAAWPSTAWSDTVLSNSALSSSALSGSALSNTAVSRTAPSGIVADDRLWQVVSGPFLAASALLVLAGLPKVRDPLPLVRALRSVGLGRLDRLVRPSSVRLLAVVETGVGVAAIIRPTRLTGMLVCLGFVAFTGFVVLALRRGGVMASCGCFGRADTPPTRTHLGLTALLALAALGVVLSPPAEPLWRNGSGSSGAGSFGTVSSESLALVAHAGLLTFLAYLVIAVLPLVTAQAVRSASTVPRRPGARPDRPGG